MTALANSLRRVWSAKSRVPHLTGWGTSGSRNAVKEPTKLFNWTHKRILELIEAAQRNVPTAIVIALNIFR